MSELDDVLESGRKQAEMEEQLRETCVFTAGELLLIRGGFFRVKATTEKRLYLDFVAYATDVIKKP